MWQNLKKVMIGVKDSGGLRYDQPNLQSHGSRLSILFCQGQDNRLVLRLHRSSKLVMPHFWPKGVMAFGPISGPISIAPILRFPHTSFYSELMCNMHLCISKLTGLERLDEASHRHRGVWCLTIHSWGLAFNHSIQQVRVGRAHSISNNSRHRLCLGHHGMSHGTLPGCSRTP